LRGDAFDVLRQPGQLAAKLRLVTEFGKPLPHHPFVEELGSHERRWINGARNSSRGSMAPCRAANP
jgi:hypothetical protein